jgi:hypothetical protein
MNGTIKGKKIIKMKPGLIEHVNNVITYREKKINEQWCKLKIHHALCPKQQ